MVDAARVRAQMRRWQDCVLDITKSNPLIGLNRSRVAKLRITAPTAEELLRLLALDEQKLRMPFVRRRKPSASQAQLFNGDQQQEELLVEPGEVTFEAEPLVLMRRLRRIYDNARTTVEERGVTTLYVTLGALRWRDDRFEDSVSPLWMVPCELARQGPDVALRLSIADEEMRLNPALEYYLREQHKVNLPAVPEDLDTDSLSRFVVQAWKAVAELDWQVTDEAWLSTFSFESLVIWADLGALTEAALANPVVAALARAVPPMGASEALPRDLDTLPTPQKVPVPALPTDSSQLEAPIHAASGKHVVVHGPPGTGKSQTIANLIADALSRNWKVLFVSAKMAALDVVHDRLKELGLDSFCLEAHSTKAGKAKIIDELRKTLEAETVSDAGRLSDELAALVRTRDALNGYVRTLHLRLEPLGISVYRAIGRLAKLKDAADIRAALPWTDPLRAGRADLERCTALLDELGRMADVFDRRDEHPWRGFEPPDTFGVLEQEILEKALDSLRQACGEILRCAAALERLVPDGASLSVEGWTGFRDALVEIIKIPRLPDGWWLLDVKALEARARLLQKGHGLKIESQCLVEKLRGFSDRPPDELRRLLEPVEGDFGNWEAVLRPAFWRWRRDVKAALKPGRSRGRRSLRQVLRVTRRLAEIEQWFNENAGELARHARPGESLRDVADCFQATAALRKALEDAGRAPTEGTTAISPEAKASVQTLLKNLPPGNAALEQAMSLIEGMWPAGFPEGLPVRKAPVSALASRLADIFQAFPRLSEWIAFRRIWRKCLERGLQPFLEALGPTSARLARRAFERRFYTLWVSAAQQRYPELRDFNPARQESLIERFRTLDDTLRRLAVEHARATAGSAVQRVQNAQHDVGTSSEVGVLRYELQKKKRFKPLRKLFAEIPHVLQALKPCLLMSPVSVSTFLKPDAFQFDLVVFDEASQLPTAEAVPSILRAQRVVVAGDSNQLPPTSFFEAALFLEEEEDDEAEGGQQPLESLLDDCVAVVPVFQEAHLRWHYRSRDERLVGFSNHNFYDDKLVTFPSPHPQAAGQGVRLVYVPDGVYDRGRSRTNRREARVVAGEVIEHFARYPERSLGVVALNINQKEAIEDAVSEELDTRPDLRPLADASCPEKFFVKSLENVQGDERDTMIISVGYGKDPDGSLTYNFGPINRDGGWRRLNVLVTRAKWECVLVTSLRSSELTGINPNNRGAVALRNYIEYAERGGEIPTPAPVITPEETNDFEDAVQEALVERGFSVDAQVGVGRYRIDLAVRDRRDPNRYVLGVECDGASYHSSRTARDRDRLRQEVLERRGWRIHRVWSTEWFHDRERALAALLRSIERAERVPSPRNVVAPPGPPEPDPDPEAVNPPANAPVRQYLAGEPYRKLRAVSRCAREFVLDPRYVAVLASIVCEIVKVEGPVCEELLIERIKELNGVERAGSNVLANIRTAIQFATRRGEIEAVQSRQFLRIRGLTLRTFRVPAEGVHRRIEQIAAEEIDLAVLHLVEDQFGIYEDQLPQAVARLFGVERLHTEAADRLRRVVEALLRRGRLRRSGTQIHLG